MFYYDKYSKNHTAELEVESEECKDSIEELLEEPEFVEIPVEDENSLEVGVVCGCVKLNVRDNPNAEASIIGTVNADSEVIVDINGSTDDFYKVTLASGMEGYCLKKFISVEE